MGRRGPRPQERQRPPKPEELLKRIVKLEKSVLALVSDCNALTNMIAESCLWLRNDGMLRAKVLRDNSDSTEAFDAFIQPISVIARNEDDGEKAKPKKGEKATFHPAAE